MSQKVLDEIFNSEGYERLKELKYLEREEGRDEFKFKVIDYENHIKGENGEKYRLQEKLL